MDFVKSYRGPQTFFLVASSGDLITSGWHTPVISGWLASKMVKREDYIREGMEFYLKRWIELSLDDTMKHWLDQYRASQGLWRTEDLRRKAQIDDLTSQLDKLSDNALAGKLHELGWIKDLTAQKSDRQRRNLLLRKEAGKLVQTKS